jgi:hypothetical protein
LHCGRIISTTDAINRDIKIEAKIYLELATLLRDMNDRTDRRALKIELNRLYEKATKEDGMIIEMFVNLVTKSLNFQRLSPVGEMELTVNFLDPILSHVFHCPDSNKHLVWLNRQDDNTTVCRSDAKMVALPQKAENVTLGYVEVRPLDVQSKPELAFMDGSICGILPTIIEYNHQLRKYYSYIKGTFKTQEEILMVRITSMSDKPQVEWMDIKRYLFFFTMELTHTLIKDLSVSFYSQSPILQVR